MAIELDSNNAELEKSALLDTVIHGDALDVLKTLPSDSIDAICTDPPSSINFMNKSWDHDKGGRTQWVAWLASIMREARRVLKPGGHALVWSLPRTSHWTALALEDAGFEIRDQIYNIVSGDTALYNFIQSLSEEQQHAFMQVIDAQREPSGIMQIFGSGFPKSLDVSKAIEKLSGIERDLVPRDRIDGKKTGFAASSFVSGGSSLQRSNDPMTPDSAKWRGYGTNLKPACENWWLVRKPLAAHSIAENVLQYGTGGLNIDASRINGHSYSQEQWEQKSLARTTGNTFGEHKPSINAVPSGRFPSHLLLTHTIFCTQSGTKKVRGDGHKTQNPRITQNGTSMFGMGQPGIERARINDEDGMETVTAWECPDFCPVRILDAQGGIRETHARGPKYEQSYHEDGAQHYAKTTNGIYGDFKGNSKPFAPNTGGASRYFQQLPALDDVPPYIYAGKASRKDRTADNTIINTHPTVKSQALLSYLCKLITPPGGIVLDCFGGSGSTAVAAISNGFHYILIEKEEEYVITANLRISHVLADVEAKCSYPYAKHPPSPDLPLAPHENDKSGTTQQGCLFHDFDYSDRG